MYWSGSRAGVVPSGLRYWAGIYRLVNRIPDEANTGSNQTCAGIALKVLRDEDMLVVMWTEQGG